MRRRATTTSAGTTPPTSKRGPLNGLEKKVARQLEDAGVAHEFEAERLSYIVPETMAKYTPDFLVVFPSGRRMYLEAKGWLRPEHRKKMKLFKLSNPGVDVRFVFQNASKPIYKGSPTSHGDWAEKHGYLWADKGVVPLKWLEE